jgi:hypothetical protein
MCVTGSQLFPTLSIGGSGVAQTCQAPVAAGRPAVGPRREGSTASPFGTQSKANLPLSSCLTQTWRSAPSAWPGNGPLRHPTFNSALFRSPGKHSSKSVELPSKLENGGPRPCLTYAQLNLVASR